MQAKITILIILVGVLSFFSFFIVYGDIKSRSELSRSQYKNLNLALINASQASESFNSQTNYVLPVSEPTYFPIRNPNFSEPVLNAKSFILYDTKNTKVLFEKNSRQPLPVASLTKILTAVVALENLNREEVVEIGRESMNTDEEGADFYLGEKFYFQDLLKAMLIKSSNDAASAVARTVENKTGVIFADLMNKKAAQIGMTNSVFLDPSGLNDQAYSTVEDLIKLVRYSKKYKEIWSILTLPFADIFSADKKFSHHLISTNKLFGVIPDMIGGKTGYTDGALGCIILEQSLPQNGTSLIVIVLGSTERFEDAKNLLEWGKNAFRWE